MKKAAVFFIALLSCLSFAGCGARDGYDKIISEIRNVQYKGSSAGISITAQSGEREADYRVDGVSHDRKPFFILSVLGVGQGAKYSFELADKTYQGTLNKHPFTDEYVASFDFKISEPITVEIDYGGNKTEIELSDAAAGAIDYNKALAIAKKELEPQIKKNSKNGTFDGEVYLRLIPNPVEDDGTYYWYAAFCKSEDECFSLLLDSKTGSLVAKKTE